MPTAKPESLAPPAQAPNRPVCRATIARCQPAQRPKQRSSSTATGVKRGFPATLGATPPRTIHSSVSADGLEATSRGLVRMRGHEGQTEAKRAGPDGCVVLSVAEVVACQDAVERHVSRQQFPRVRDGCSAVRGGCDIGQAEDGVGVVQAQPDGNGDAPAQCTVGQGGPVNGIFPRSEAMSSKPQGGHAQNWLLTARWAATWRIISSAGAGIRRLFI